MCVPPPPPVIAKKWVLEMLRRDHSLDGRITQNPIPTPRQTRPRPMHSININCYELSGHVFSPNTGAPHKASSTGLPYFDIGPVGYIPTDLHLFVSPPTFAYYICTQVCLNVPFFVQFRASRIKPHKCKRHRTAECFEVQKWTKVGTLRLLQVVTSRTTAVGGWKKSEKAAGTYMPAECFSSKKIQ